MNSLLITMTILGSIPFVLFCLLKKLPGYICASKAQLLLLFSIISYILPFPLLSVRLRNVYSYFFQSSSSFWFSSIQKAPVFSVNDEVVFWEKQSSVYHILVYIWVVGFIFFTLKCFYKYFMLRKKIAANCIYERNCHVSFLFIKRNIKIYHGENIGSPFSTGFFRPIIVMPKNLSKDKEQLILLHEQTHIKRMDFLFCFLSSMVRSIHWFNPLVYFLTNNLKINQEYLVDKEVIKGLNEASKHEYGQLIIDSSNRNVCKNFLSSHVSSLNNEEFKILRERIKRIKNMINNKKPKTFAVIMALVAAVIINLFPILVYSAPIKITGNISADGDTYLFIPNGAPNALEEYSFDLSNMYFQSEAGDRIPIYSNDLKSSPKTACTHSWVHGEIQKHQKHSDRSCDVVIYKAKRCEKCGDIQTMGRIRTIHYDVCPH